MNEANSHCCPEIRYLAALPPSPSPSVLPRTSDGRDCEPVTFAPPVGPLVGRHAGDWRQCARHSADHVLPSDQWTGHPREDKRAAGLFCGPTGGLCLYPDADDGTLAFTPPTQTMKCRIRDECLRALNGREEGRTAPGFGLPPVAVSTSHRTEYQLWGVPYQCPRGWMKPRDSRGRDWMGCGGPECARVTQRGAATRYCVVRDDVCRVRPAPVVTCKT